MSVINHGQARRIASDWHGGQSSPLYSLASCGYVDRDGLEVEIDDNLKWCRANPATDEGRGGLRDLPALRAYVASRSDGGWQGHGAWHRLWDECAV